MITKLTKQQEAKFPEYVKTWAVKGLTTRQRTLADAIRDFSEFQRLILQKKKIAPVVILNSPTECWAAVLMVKRLFGSLQVQSQVDSQVESQVDSQVRSQVRSQVWSQVQSQVWSQVKSQVWSQVGSQVKDFVWPYFDCQFWASWFSCYEFMKNELGLIYGIEYEAFKACVGYGMVFPLDELCIVCQPPSQIHKNANGLHNENGPAVSYNGENEIYALNGVTMTKDYVMTSAHEISSETILKESNAEVRRELIRKVGIEKMLTSLPHKLLQKRGNYELYSLNLSDEVKDARYLKMTNPSIGVFHLEGVAPEILTIDAALNWRNQNMFTDAEVLT